MGGGVVQRRDTRAGELEDHVRGVRVCVCAGGLPKAAAAGREARREARWGLGGERMPRHAARFGGATRGSRVFGGGREETRRDAPLARAGQLASQQEGIQQFFQPPRARCP